MLAKVEMVSNRAVGFSLAISRVMFALLSQLALFVAACYPADVRESALDDLTKPTIIDSREIRFSPLLVNGETLQSSVTSIAQDDYGFLWFGTSAGLYRYDGYNLTNYRHEGGNSNSLSEDTVRAIYKARDGTLWISTQGGVDRLNPSNGVFSHYRHEASKPQTLASNSVGSIYQDRSGGLWIATSDGIVNSGRN